MKTIFYLICAVAFALICYVVEKRVRHAESDVVQPSAVQYSEGDRPEAENTIERKNCPCCSNKELTPAQVKAKQKQQQREAWARRMIADHGYEEGLKRISAQKPLFAKQMQRILDREKRLEDSLPASPPTVQ